MPGVAARFLLSSDSFILILKRNHQIHQIHNVGGSCRLLLSERGRVHWLLRDREVLGESFRRHSARVRDDHTPKEAKQNRPIEKPIERKKIACRPKVDSVALVDSMTLFYSLNRKLQVLCFNSIARVRTPTSGQIANGRIPVAIIPVPCNCSARQTKSDAAKPLRLPQS